MRKSILTIAAMAACVFVLGKANAMPLNSAVGDAADRLSAVEKTQFVYLGRNYCWYPDGWHGPGFYWCGYAWRSGFGWGGPIGWRGWRGPGFRAGVGHRIGGPGMRVVGPRMGGGPRMMGPRMGGGGGGGGGSGRRH